MKLFWNVFQKDNINIDRKPETHGSFGCPEGVEKSELFSQETYHSQNFRYETLRSPLLKKKLSMPSYLISCESHKRLKVHFCSFSLIT